MRKNSLLLTLLLSLSLVSCGGGSNNSESNSIESDSVIDSDTNESESFIESESESESVSESEEHDFTYYLENRVNFKQFFTEWLERNELTSIDYTLDDTKAYKKGVSEVYVYLAQNELIYQASFEGVDETQSYNETKYYGLFPNSGLYYEVELSDTKNRSTRYTLSDVEEDINLYRDVINLSEAENRISNNSKKYGTSIVGQTLGWNIYVNGTTGFNDLSWSYDYDSSKDEYYVYGETVVVGSLDITRYSFEATIFKENIIEGSLNSTAYKKDDFDLELNIPKDGVSEKNHKNSVIKAATYGEKERVTESSYIGINSLFISEITSFTFKQSLYDAILGTEVYGNANEVFADSIIEFRYDQLLETTTFLPETARDFESIVIVASSNEEVVYRDEFGYWRVSSQIGGKTTLTIGTYNRTLFSFLVEVVKNPTIHPTPDFSNEAIKAVTEDVIISQNTDNTYDVSIPVSGEAASVFAIPTTNEGPFNLVDFAFNYNDYSFYPSFLSDNSFYEGEGLNYVYIEIYGYKATKAPLEIVNQDGETVYNFTVTVR